jgi:hypothetical protein
MQGRVTQINLQLDKQREGQGGGDQGGGDLSDMMRADGVGALKEELRELSQALQELLPEVQKEGGKAYVCAMPGDRITLTNKQNEVSAQLGSLQTQIAQVVMKATMLPSSSPRPTLAAGAAPAGSVHPPAAAGAASPLAPSPLAQPQSADTMSFVRQLPPAPEGGGGGGGAMSGFGFMNSPETVAQQEAAKKEAEEQAKREAEEQEKKAEQEKLNAAFGGFGVGGSDLNSFMNIGS